MIILIRKQLEKRLHQKLSHLLYLLAILNALVIAGYLYSFTIPHDEVFNADIASVRTSSYLMWKKSYPEWSEEQLQTWTDDVVSEYIEYSEEKSRSKVQNPLLFALAFFAILFFIIRGARANPFRIDNPYLRSNPWRYLFPLLTGKYVARIVRNDVAEVIDLETSYYPKVRRQLVKYAMKHEGFLKSSSGIEIDIESIIDMNEYKQVSKSK